LAQGSSAHILSGYEQVPWVMNMARLSRLALA
jgi:hypothetical protein